MGKFQFAIFILLQCVFTGSVFGVENDVLKGDLYIENGALNLLYAGYRAEQLSKDFGIEILPTDLVVQCDALSRYPQELLDKKDNSLIDEYNNKHKKSCSWSYNSHYQLQRIGKKFPIFYPVILFANKKEGDSFQFTFYGKLIELRLRNRIRGKNFEQRFDELKQQEIAFPIFDTSCLGKPKTHDQLLNEEYGVDIDNPEHHTYEFAMSLRKKPSLKENKKRKKQHHKRESISLNSFFLNFSRRSARFSSPLFKDAYKKMNWRNLCTSKINAVLKKIRLIYLPKNQ